MSELEHGSIVDFEVVSEKKVVKQYSTKMGMVNAFLLAILNIKGLSQFR